MIKVLIALALVTVEVLCISSSFIGKQRLVSLKTGDFRIDDIQEKLDYFILKKKDKLCVVHAKTKNGFQISNYHSELKLDEIDSNVCDEVLRRGFGHKAIFGVYELPLGKYLLTVKSSTPLTGVPFHDVERANEFVLVKISSQKRTSVSNDDLLEEQNKAERILLRALNRHHFYFSRGRYDILRTFQSNSIANAEDISQRNENQFFWNRQSVKCFLDHNYTDFVTPMCNAWIGSNVMKLGGIDIRMTLISRRSSRRQGPRYMKRGSDIDGDVANFVETEQIVERLDANGNSSFVQIRGSIPFFWKQENVWKPRPTVSQNGNASEDLQVLSIHLNDLAKSYCVHSLSPKEVYLVNLLDKKGSQGKLGSTWKQYLSLLAESISRGSCSKSKEKITTSFLNTSLNRSEITSILYPFSLRKLQSIVHKQRKHADYASSRPALNDDNEAIGTMDDDLLVKLIWFDYHHHFAEHQSQGLLPLFEHIKDGIMNDGSLYLHYQLPTIFQKRQIQTKIIRTNCLDCLDRTNVVQSMISRWILLRQVGLLGGKLRLQTALEEHLQLPDEVAEKAFKRLWIDNGDYISVLYAGSRAMKRDVTKTGIRTKQGMMDDAISYAKRYIANNYIDQSRQVGIDYLLGERQCIFEKSTITTTTNLSTSMNNMEEADIDTVEVDHEIIESDDSVLEEKAKHSVWRKTPRKGRKKGPKDRMAIVASILSIALLLLL